MKESERRRGGGEAVGGGGHKEQEKEEVEENKKEEIEEKVEVKVEEVEGYFRRQWFRLTRTQLRLTLPRGGRACCWPNLLWKESAMVRRSLRSRSLDLRSLSLPLEPHSPLFSNMAAIFELQI